MESRDCVQFSLRYKHCALGFLDSPERQSHCFRTARFQSCLAKAGPNVLQPKAGTLPKAKGEL